MAQSLIAGLTNYDEQNILDIKEDITRWIEYSIKLKDLFEKTIKELSEEGYWANNVSFEFRAFCQDVPRICNSFVADFNIVLKAIEADNITNREIKLLRKIYQVSCENEEYSWKSFKGEDTLGRWHQYGNPLFEKAEILYQDGRDFFVTLRDVSNAASRLEDYMKEEKTVVDNSIHTDNSITIGDGNKIKKSIVGNGNTVESTDKKSSFWEKFGLPLIITIIGGVAVAGICIWLGLK